MELRKMTLADISVVVPLYLDCYNGPEGGQWTEQTAHKRIHQVLTMEGAYGTVLEEAGEIRGFAMGFFKPYDDCVGYTLEEILIAPAWQNRGLGSAFLQLLEEQVRAMGAACVELQAVNDEMHERYYGKAGYKNARNFVMKVKWLV